MMRRGILKTVNRLDTATDLISPNCHHTYRAACITIHVENGGPIEDAASLAGDCDSRLRRLYIRKTGRIQPTEAELVRI